MKNLATIDNRQIKVMHIINDLDIGGAEKMLCKLTTGSDRRCFRHQVISLLPAGILQQELRQAGIEVLSLNMERNRFDLFALCRLAKLINKFRPDVIHTWMYISDIFGTIAALPGRAWPLIYSIRHGSFTGDSIKTIVLARIVAMLSQIIPERIVACSTASGELHRQIGYAGHKMVIIPNGFTLHKNTDQGKLRQALGVAAAAPIIGMIGRFNPAKDHQNFIDAAALVKIKFPACEFVLCGAGVNNTNQYLTRAIAAAGLEKCVHLLGNQIEIGWILSDLAFLVSSSASEAFANVIGEAMASGISCVVTDVGDSAHIVGNTGIIVPPRDPGALAKGMLKMLDRSSAELEVSGKQAQKRIEQLFSLAEIVRSYEKLYLEVVNGRRKRR